MRKPRKLPSLRFILIAGTLLLLLITQLAGLSPNLITPTERLDLLTRDLLFRIRGPRQTSGDIVIVAIDDFSFNWTGYSWPWPRDYLAQIVDQVNAGGRAWLVWTCFFSLPHPIPHRMNRWRAR